MSELLRAGCEKPQLTVLPAKSISYRSSTLAASQSGRLVQRAIAYIRQNCKRPINAKWIAENLGVSRPLLDLRFRELIGTSVGKTIDAERLNAVCEQLTGTDATIGEIAIECGYADGFQLMHKFKRHFGMTASAYRKTTGNRPLPLESAKRNRLAR